MYFHDPRDARDVDIDAINAEPRYAMHVVLAADNGFQPVEARSAAAIADAVESCGVSIRGWYDIAGFTSEADLMVWLIADDPTALQAAYRTIRRSVFGCLGTESLHLTPVWSVVSVHRPAEFNTSHVPACLGGVMPREWLTVYPFVRSLDWYWLEPEKRSVMLREHGMAARNYPDVKGSTMQAFALGDYEWILSFEADELHRLTDSMRHQRAAEARLHVRDETPFFTGQRVELSEWLERRA